MIDLDTLITHGKDHARTCLLNKGYTQLTPLWHLISKDNKSFIIGTPWKNAIQKEMVYLLMRKRLKEANIRLFSFMAETWISFYEKDESTSTRPSERPNRVEAVFIFASSRSEQKVATLEIKRENGKIIGLPNLTFPDAKALEGMIPSLFD